MDMVRFDGHGLVPASQIIFSATACQSLGPVTKGHLKHLKVINVSSKEMKGVKPHTTSDPGRQFGIPSIIRWNTFNCLVGTYILILQVIKVSILVRAS